MKILAIIPARGGSKGIKRKNLTILDKKPLIQYTIEAGLEAMVFDRIILSSDDPEIMDFVVPYPIEVPFQRPKVLATDGTPMLDVVRHALNELRRKENYSPDAVALLQPTSPLRTAKHIREAAKLFVDHSPDTLVSVVKVPHNYIPESVYSLKDGYLNRYCHASTPFNRYEKPQYYARNGPAILMVKCQVLMDSDTFYGDYVLPFEMLASESVDIDTMEDLALALHYLTSESPNETCFY